jgi:hypothetical protein
MAIHLEANGQDLIQQRLRLAGTTLGHQRIGLTFQGEGAAIALLLFLLRLQHTADRFDIETRFDGFPVIRALCLSPQFR